MLNTLIRWSLANRLAVITVTAIICVLGAWVAIEMPVDVLPDLTAPTVTVLVEGKGMAPEEMETLVTFPIEAAVNGANRVRRVRSATAVGIAVIWIEFDWESDIHRARQTVNERLATVIDRLPPSVDPPILAPISSIMGEILFLSLSSTAHDPMTLRSFATTELRRRLLALPGVSQVTPIGGEEKQYQVVIDPSRLRAYDIRLSMVADALRDANENVSAGFHIEGGEELLIRGLGRARTIEDLRQTVVALREDYPVRLADLGEVRLGPAVKRGDGAVSYRDAEGRPVTRSGVIIAVQKQPGANTLELTHRLDALLDDVESTLPEGMLLHRHIFRQAYFINHAVDNMVAALKDGGIMVVLVVVLFLFSFRASIITLVAMPVSLLVTFLGLRLLGGSINTMSLGGMAIAVGMLVDDAIIDVENIVRRLRENAAAPVPQRRALVAVIYAASTEVRGAIVFATMIIILVFCPLFFLSGVEGRLLVPLGTAFVVSLAASLVVALTVTPALSFYLLPKSRAITAAVEPRLSRWCKAMYDAPLRSALSRPLAIIIPTMLLFAAASASVTRLGKSFLPEFNEGALVVGLSTVPGTSLGQSDQLADLVQREFMRHPEVVAIGRRTGRAEQDEHVQGVDASEIDMTIDMEAPVRLGLPSRTRDELLAALRDDLAMIPGVRGTIGQPISHRIDHMLSGTRASIAVKIFGSDLSQLRGLAARVESAMRNIRGVVDLSTERQIGIGALTVDYERQAMARHGLHAADLGLALESAGAGRKIGEVLEDKYAYDLVLRTNAAGREHSRTELQQISIDTPAGGRIPMKAVARVYEDRSPNFIARENVQRKIVVMCNVKGRDVVSVVRDVQAAVESSVNLPAGYYIEYGGQFESAVAANRRLAWLSAIVVLGIGFLLHVAFKSGRDAIIVLINLPLALIGGVFGAWLAGGDLSIASIIGFISVFGIATRNGIMLVSHVRYLQQEEGVHDFFEAIRRGATERLIPILMTAVSAALALLPLALGRGQPGKEILYPMAMVILFGLISSTVLNMLVVPALYRMFGRPAEAVPASPDYSTARRAFS